MTTSADQVSTLAIEIINLVEPAVAFGLSPRDPAIVEQVAELLAEFPPEIAAAALVQCSSRHAVAETVSELTDRPTDDDVDNNGAEDDVLIVDLDDDMLESDIASAFQ